MYIAHPLPIPVSQPYPSDVTGSLDAAAGLVPGPDGSQTYFSAERSMGRDQTRDQPKSTPVAPKASQPKPRKAKTQDRRSSSPSAKKMAPLPPRTAAAPIEMGFWCLRVDDQDPPKAGPGFLEGGVTRIHVDGASAAQLASAVPGDAVMFTEVVSLSEGK
ncbi:hypothetical protein KIPB_009897 [Kipferlia bialata]|uniref:Uncharacterized protein n=1 Tax=Kipferlia bialata TaxID=797122 RepID=A0A9K3D4L1_9EUKA|nr:hypothetical protein KIPB_009897 [Kipferlia bialata]|eukprot:g9897.t1